MGDGAWDWGMGRGSLMSMPPLCCCCALCVYVAPFSVMPQRIKSKRVLESGKYAHLFDGDDLEELAGQ